jgi:hypothetical protein
VGGFGVGLSIKEREIQTMSYRKEPLLIDKGFGLKSKENILLSVRREGFREKQVL